MKALFTAALAVLASVALGQTFSDDFESYSPGDYIAASSADWTTWNGQTGGATDGQVSDAQANNGSNSLHIYSTASGGGPMDLVLPFAAEHSLGQFSYEMALWVESGNGGYFNFQKEDVPGTTWAMDCWFNDLGELRILSGGNVVVLANFTHETWFTMRFEIDFNTNTWELFIDGVSQGNWASPHNQVASCNIYPVNNQYGGNDASAFYVDDVSYDYTPYTIAGLNASATNILTHGLLSGMETNPTVTVRNLGTTALTSVDIEVSHNGSSISESFSGFNIPSGAEKNFHMADPLTLAAADNSIVATISNINAQGADDLAGDDVKTLTLNLTTPAPDKVVVVEEATGTWCVWCPRGAVMMDSMAARYPDHLITIAVHNGDPMVDTVYDDGLNVIISGYPSATVNRGGDIDPLAIEGDFLARIAEAPSARLTLGAESVTTDSITVSVTTEWLQDVGENWKVAIVLTEDALSGTTSEWAQANAYAGGDEGVMGGYELLPSPVPANQMVYDHVARTIIPAFTGTGQHFDASMLSGSSYTLVAGIRLGADWDINNMHVVAMLIDPEKAVDNAVTATVIDAVGNGLQDGYVLQVPHVNAGSTVAMYPNPASDYSLLEVETAQPAEVHLRLLTVDGRVVAQRNYGMVSGNAALLVRVGSLAPGIYLAEITVGSERSVQRLVVR